MAEQDGKQAAQWQGKPLSGIQQQLAQKRNIILLQMLTERLMWRCTKKAAMAAATNNNTCSIMTVAPRSVNASLRSVMYGPKSSIVLPRIQKLCHDNDNDNNTQL